MSNLEQLKGVFSLVSRFDIYEDDNTIDKLICHAIEQGVDTNDYDCIDEGKYIELYV